MSVRAAHGDRTAWEEVTVSFVCVGVGWGGGGGVWVGEGQRAGIARILARTRACMPRRACAHGAVPDQSASRSCRDSAGRRCHAHTVAGMRTRDACVRGAASRGAYACGARVCDTAVGMRTHYARWFRSRHDGCARARTSLRLCMCLGNIPLQTPLQTPPCPASNPVPCLCPPVP